MTTLSPIIEQESMLQITSEFSRLKDRCYLDNAGANLYPKNLLQRVNDDLINNIYMNPHTDKFTNDCIESVRNLILQHFNADPSEYSVIFTSGTTQSLKLVVESFLFTSDDKETNSSGSFLYLLDNHTSVLGLREIAEDRNVDILHISHDDFLSLDLTKTQPSQKIKQCDGNSLFVFPAQSNFNGYKYPIDNLDSIRNGCLNNYVRKHLCNINCNWYILLDAASFVATNKLDLSVVQPDFLCFSFYKIFGYPTGLGALIVKNSSGHVLSQKKYFGGGTVDIVLSSEDFHVKRQVLHERFEDGTDSFLSIISLRHCFEVLKNLIPPVVNNDIMETISYHTYLLAKDLYHQLSSLLHPNGEKAVILYLDTEFVDIKRQGGMVTFNLLRDDGTYIGYAEFQHMADLFNIHVRTGCFCNSGSCQRHLKATNKEMKEMYNAGHRCGDELDLVNGKPTGAVRASFAYYNTYNDVDTLVAMICKCFIKISPTKPIRFTKEGYYNYVSEPEPCDITACEENKILIIKDEKVLDSLDNCSNSDMSLEEISIFPIKSCGAFKVKADWKIGEKGFEYDREWMIVNNNGICLTQKNCTKMCMIRPNLDLEENILELNFEGTKAISVPIDPIVYNNNSKFSFCRSKVCMDTVKGIDCGDEVADWISEVLEISFLRLIKQSVDDSRFMKHAEKGLKYLSLSNQAQYLLINKATVQWLADHINDPLFSDDIQQLTDRFRGNLVIDTDEALIELEWERIIIGNHEFKVEGQCRRCQMICIDQQTGEKTVEPLRTISQQFAGKMRFGIYLSYVGAMDSSMDRVLKLNSSVQPIVIDKNR